MAAQREFAWRMALGAESRQLVQVKICFDLLFSLSLLSFFVLNSFFLNKKVIYCGLPGKGVNSYWEFGETSSIANYFCNRGYDYESGDKQRNCYVDSADKKIKWLGIPLVCNSEYFFNRLNNIH